MIYFVQAGQDGPIKIGFTADGTAASRVSKLQTANAAQLRVIGEVEGGQYLEFAIHAQLARFRLRGEWFSPDPAVDAMLATLMAGNFAVGDVDLAGPRASPLRFSSPGLRLELPQRLSNVIRSVALRVDIDPQALVIDALFDVFGLGDEIAKARAETPTSDAVAEKALEPVSAWTDEFKDRADELREFKEALDALEPFARYYEEHKHEMDGLPDDATFTFKIEARHVKRAAAAWRKLTGFNSTAEYLAQQDRGAAA